MVASDELHPKVTDVKQIVGASRANQTGRFSSHAGRATSAAARSTTSTRCKRPSSSPTTTAHPCTRRSASTPSTHSEPMALATTGLYLRQNGTVPLWTTAESQTFGRGRGLRADLPRRPRASGAETRTIGELHTSHVKRRLTRRNGSLVAHHPHPPRLPARGALCERRDAPSARKGPPRRDGPLVRATCRWSSAMPRSTGHDRNPNRFQACARTRHDSVTAD